MPENDLHRGEDHGPLKAERVGLARWGNSVVSTRLLRTVCVLQFILLLALAVALWRAWAPPFSRPGAAPVADSSDLYFKGHPGPWGDLEYARIVLEPPDQFIPVDGNFFGPTRWFFEGYNRDTLTEFFGQCGLTASQSTELKNPATWNEKPGGIEVAPGDDLILALPAPAREKIYAVLANSRLNISHLWPFKAPGRSVDEWFGQSHLSPETLALMKKLTYFRGGRLCFSDLPFVYPRVPTNEERRRLIKTLARSSALLVKLQLRPDSDVEALADYWAQGRRNKDIETLLESLTKFPHGMTIDVTHLLPAFARKRLYTFPEPSLDGPTRNWPNCNWTAMNFFRDPPDDRFYNSDVWGNELEQNYTKAKKATFGDLIVFYRSDGLPIHMVVFIADDIVFTKDGSSSLNPWTLMKWDDLIADYTLEDSPTYIIFHPKEPEE